MEQILVGLIVVLLLVNIVVVYLLFVGRKQDATEDTQESLLLMQRIDELELVLEEITYGS